MLSVPPCSLKARLARICAAIGNPMTKPDRLPAASATLAQAAPFSTAGPVARADHDRMANAIRALATVSYTHLDVYKRQPYDQAQGQGQGQLP